eukprot:s30_g39.t1
MQGDIPTNLMRAAVRFDVAESDYLLLQHHGIATLNSFAFKIPKSEDLEVFLQDRILGMSAYKGDDGVVTTFQRVPAIRWADWKLSDDAAALRRLWTFSRETARGEMEKMTNSEDSRRKTTLLEAVTMETAAIARGCPAPVSDKERPSLFTLNRLSRALHTPGATYEVLPWEAYLSKEEEDRLMRDGKLPKSHYTELVFKEDKLVAKEKTGPEIPAGVSSVSDMETLRARLDLRARAMDMLELAKFQTVRALSDLYYGKMNATIASGMRCPTLNEVRRFDREMQTVMFRHLSRGDGTLEEALSYYLQGNDSLWRLLDPVLGQLPDQGVESGHEPAPSSGHKRKAEPSSEEAAPAASPPKNKPPVRCLMCKKIHTPLCPLPEWFRKQQRENRKKKKAAAKAAKAKKPPTGS